MKKRILFVCLGNICRSPAAEEIFRSMASHVEVDSCGTSAYHEGELADPRMRQHGEKRGYQLTSRSRPFLAPDDFKSFDLILVMDASNKKNLEKLPGYDELKVEFFTKYATEHDDVEVPDPYFGGDEGFDYVYNLLEDCGQGLVKSLSV